MKDSLDYTKYQALMDQKGALKEIKIMIEENYMSKMHHAMEILNAISSGDISIEREKYNILIKKFEENLNNRDLTISLVKSLADTKDCRALFPLINLFYKTDDLSIKGRVLDYIECIKDPRSADFLTDFLKNDHFEIKTKSLDKLLEFNGRVKNIIPNLNKENFMYRYSGRSDLFELALEFPNSILVNKTNILDNIDSVLNDDRPQTYIIKKSGEIFIGGNTHEHVYVASGQDVLAAGEIMFSFDNNFQNCSVSYINNRSNGYHPSKESFIHLLNYFGSCDIDFDKKTFDEIFPIYGFNNQDYLNNFRLGDHVQFY